MSAVRSHSQSQRLTIPNLLTLLRVASVPLFVIIFYLPLVSARLICTGLFIIAAITDWLDGYLARQWHQTSPLGAFLDPVADKLMVTVVLVLLVAAEPTLGLAVPAAIIIGREITVTALREWMARLGARDKVAVSQLGKIKTTLQMTAIVLLLLKQQVFGFSTLYLGWLLLCLAALLTLWSMIVYLLAAWPDLVNMANGS